MTDEQDRARVVEGDFAEAIDSEVLGSIGFKGLHDYGWASDELNDGSWPFAVVKDGREFEVDIHITAVELTPEVKARRAAEVERVQAMLAERGITR